MAVEITDKEPELLSVEDRFKITMWGLVLLALQELEDAGYGGSRCAHWHDSPRGCAAVRIKHLLLGTMEQCPSQFW